MSRIRRVRPSWDQYFVNIAEVVASRSTCNRASVGVVIVRENRILAAGYNGAPFGEPHCGPECNDSIQHCLNTVHAECNAIASAAKYGISVDGATMYIWGDRDSRSYRCENCRKMIKQAGIIKVVDKFLAWELLDWARS